MVYFEEGLLDLFGNLSFLVRGFIGFFTHYDVVEHAADHIDQTCVQRFLPL